MSFPCPKKGCPVSCNSEAQFQQHLEKHTKKGKKGSKVCRNWSKTGETCNTTCMVSKCNKKHKCECGKPMVSTCIPSPVPFFNKGCEETVCICGVREKCPRWHCNDLKCGHRSAKKEGFIRCDGPNGESWKMPASSFEFGTLNVNLCPSCDEWTVLNSGGPDQTTSCPFRDNVCAHGVSKGTLHCTDTNCGWVDAEPVKPVEQTAEEMEAKHDEETFEETFEETSDKPAIQPADSWEGKGKKETRFFENPSPKKKYSPKKKSSPKKSLKKKSSSEKPGSSSRAPLTEPTS